MARTEAGRLMAHAPFVHLRVRSAYSLLEGAVRYEALVERCADPAWSMPAVAVTDHANLFGAMQFCAAAKDSGVQPIVGALMPLGRSDDTKTFNGGNGKPQPEELVTLLVQDEVGFRNLLALMSHAYLEAAPNLGRVEIAPEILAERSEGLVLLDGGAFGPLGAAIRRGDRPVAGELVELLLQAFGDRFYVELQRHGLAEEDACEMERVDLAFARGIPLVATNDVHFMDEDMHRAHDALICIAEGTQISVDDRRRLTPEHRFKSADEMTVLFAELPEAISNTIEIARRCAFATPERAPILPRYETEAGRDESDELRAQAREGLEERLAAHVLKPEMDKAERDAACAQYRDRLEFELDVIVQMQFPGYFLIVSDFIKWAKARDIPVGPGRGSGAGSVVAWSLKITDLDPIRFGLLFERFLNPERVSMPDFDIDFCQDRRDEVIRYVQTRFGADNVAAIITFGKLQARAVLRDVGRVMGLPFGLVDKICKLVPFNPAHPPTLDQALELEPRLQAWRQDDEAVGQMIEVALKLEGLPRHASTHAAGVVIGDRTLDELIPLYRDPRAMMPVTQFNMKDVEKAGLVKFDFLGLTTLTLLRMAEDLVKARGTPLALDKLELDDPAVYRLLSKADTAGVFQLESGGMRDALKKLKADCFEDIIAMVSLYRPGPMDNIPRYIAVKHGREQPAYLHPLLKPILEETNGVIIYQEQVMEIAKQLAGYTLGGADLLRRAMGKKIQAEMDAQREVFVRGAMERGIGEGLANTIFDQVAKFASYGFNKSHAAAYALLAYHTAYLKANHTVEFYCAVMTMEMGNQEKLAMFRQEMVSKGIPSYPPDINNSGVLFGVEDGTDGTGVRHALAAIKGVGRQAMTSLVAEREANGPFVDIFDLAARLGPKTVNKRIMEGLIRAGALDGLDANRCRLVASLDQVLRHGAACQDMESSEQASLFGSGASAKPPPPALAQHEDWPQLERLQHEFSALGFYMSAHPLDGYKHRLERLGVVPAAEIRAHIALHDNNRVKLAGVVLGKQERNSARGRYAFVQLSDTSAQYEVALFSEILNESRELLEGGRSLILEVDARSDGEEVRLTALDMTLLDEAEEDPDSIVEIELADIGVAPALKPYLQVNGARAARVRLVVPAKDAAAVISLPEAFGLPSPSRMDVERLDGVVAVRDLAAN